MSSVNHPGAPPGSPASPSATRQAIGATDAELGALAIAAWEAVQDNDVTRFLPLATLLRRLATESDGGIAGSILARLAMLCRGKHTSTAVDPGPPSDNRAWCALCGMWVA